MTRGYPYGMLFTGSRHGATEQVTQGVRTMTTAATFYASSPSAATPPIATTPVQRKAHNAVPGALPVTNADGFPLLGQLCWWDVSSIITPYEPFRAAWLTAGLPGVTFNACSEYDATRRGFEDWLAARGIAHGFARKSSSAAIADQVRTLVRPVKNGHAEHHMFTLITEKVDMKLFGMDHATGLRVFLRKSDGSISISTNKTGAPGAIATGMELNIGAEIVSYRARYLGALTGDSIRVAMRDALKLMGATQVRADGGVYFAPPAVQDQLTAIKGLLEPLGGSLTVLDMPDTAKAKAEIVKNINQGLIAEVSSLSAEIDRLDGKSRLGTMTTRLNEINALTSKVRAMAGLLNMQADELTGALGGLAKVVGNKMAAAGPSF